MISKPRRWSGLTSVGPRNLQIESQKTDRTLMSTLSWATRFGVTDRQVADLTSQLAGHDEPLRWLLAHGHIPGGDYALWAMDEYSLPIVRDEFFSVPADPVFWEAVRSEFAWTPSFYPLAEWQGVLLIGCLEPPRFHFPLHTPHRFVIASAQALETRYNELNAFEAPVAAPVAPTPKSASPAYVEPAPLAKTAAAKSAAPAYRPPVEVVAKVRQRPADEVLAEDLPAAPNVSLADPDGLVGDIELSSSPNLFVVPDGLPLDDIGQPLPIKPDGLGAVTSHEDHESRLLNLDNYDFSAADPSAQSLSPDAEPVIPVSAAAVPPAPKLPPGPPPVMNVVAATPRATVLPKPIEDSGVHASTVMPPIPKAAASTANVAASEPAIPLSTCATLDSLMSATIAHVSTLFEHGILFVVENGRLSPKKWSELLLSVKGDSPDAVLLDQPSIFRIAYRTALPYHGYVVSNPTNATFFNAFNRGQTPKHVTLMPITNSGQVVAMVMGLSSVEIDYKASLSAMEKLASDFGTQLERLRAKKIAA